MLMWEGLPRSINWGGNTEKPRVKQAPLHKPHGRAEPRCTRLLLATTTSNSGLPTTTSNAAHSVS